MLGVILDIILLVLKIIGILLLSILGLIVILLLIVLFVPVRYKSSGQFNKTEEGLEHQIYAKITWCLHIVSIRFQRVDNENVLVFKLFGIDLLNRKKNNKNDRIKEKKKKPKGNKDIKQDNITLTSSTKKDEVKDNMKKDVVIIQKTDVSETTKKTTNLEMNIKDNAKTVDVEGETKKEPIFTRLKNKALSFIEKLKGICDKIRNINNVKNSFIDYLKRDTSKKAIKEIINKIFKLFKHILPRKLKATVGFGFEDPSTTGNALGYASIFYGIYGDNIELEPNFDEQVLYGKYALKGHIRMFPLLVIAWKIYRNKWLREFVTFSKETIKEI